MKNYKIQVKLEDDTLADFKSFVILGVCSEMEVTLEEVEHLQVAKDKIQQYKQDELCEFMLDNKFEIEHFEREKTIKAYKFISWYKCLSDKKDFIKLLEELDNE